LDIRYIRTPQNQRHYLIYSGIGHLWWWRREEAGVVEKGILEEHGAIARWNGLLGVRFIFGGHTYSTPQTDAIIQTEYLWIADPKAIHHILQAASHLYEKPAFTREQIATLMDNGLASTAGESESFVFHRVKLLILSLGDVHKRQRRAMTPAFGLVEAKALYPYLSRCSDSVSHFPIYA
jgi:cytochrome P450